MPGEAKPNSVTENTASLALDLSRRDFVATASATAGGFALAQGSAGAATVGTDIANLPPYGNSTLPPGIRSRSIANVNGLTVHILEAGYEVPGRPAVLLLHGFPELAYSWRKVMLPLAAAGYHAIAPDQRGYGRTTGWDDSYDADPDPFRILNMVRDAMGLVFALGYREVAGVVGHDAGSPVAAWSALIRPDVFRSVTMMSSPFAGVPSLPFNTANGAPPPRPAQTDDELDAELAKLSLPRKYYQNYQRTHGANDDMLHAPQGLHAFFRAYYHYKSADWKDNKPHALKARTAAEMAKIPTYYVMERDKGMAATVAPFMPSAAEIAQCKWLTEAEATCTPRNTRGPNSPAHFRAIGCGAARTPRALPRCTRSQAALSMCHPCSSGARATGASTRPPAPPRACRRPRAPAWWAFIWWTTPAIGCSRSSLGK